MDDRVNDETDLIQTYLAPLAAGAPGALGLRDDAAYFTPPPGTDLVVTTDPIIAGVHFFASERPDDIAWKALAVNVSDLAAKGAAPLAYTMALALPQAPQRAWMAEFARGLAAAQAEFGCVLLGGDTDRTSGPLSISITVFGVVPAGRMVQRRTARIGDHVFVTGTLGDAALGLRIHGGAWPAARLLTSGDAGFLTARYLRPSPRLALAPLLRAYASAALDVSDGLLKDLARLAGGASGAVRVALAVLPLSSSARLLLDGDASCIGAVIAGGDDYEILFTVPAPHVAAFMTEAAGLPFKVSEIGRIEAGAGASILAHDGTAIEPGNGGGWDHFS